MGLGGATLVGAGEGFGHHKKLHSVHFFDLADQPLEVIMVPTRDEFSRLFERLAAQQEPTIRAMGVIWPGETGTF
jgi:PII-like signaling protein